MKPLFLALVVVALSPSSCTDWFYGRHYDATETGELKGKLVVEWIDQDKFLFLPDADNPLVFRRKNDEVIEPLSLSSSRNSSGSSTVTLVCV